MLNCATHTIHPINIKNNTYENLVLEGCGVLGTAYIGAIDELADLGIKFKNYAATSFSSIIVGALACGASTKFLRDEFHKVDFKSFMDYGNELIACYNLIREKGFCKGDIFLKWYRYIIKSLTGDENITLQQIHDRFGGKVYIISTNMDTRRPVYFNYCTHPNLQLCMAVRMSMSLPLVYEPVGYDGSIYIDGCLSDNFPIQVFNAASGKTLGLTVISSMVNEPLPPQVTDLKTFTDALIDCVINRPQKIYMDTQTWTCVINCSDISSHAFIADTQTKDYLILAGREAVGKYFYAMFSKKSINIPRNSITPATTPSSSPSLVGSTSPLISSTSPLLSSTSPPINIPRRSSEFLDMTNYS